MRHFEWRLFKNILAPQQSGLRTGWSFGIGRSELSGVGGQQESDKAGGNSVELHFAMLTSFFGCVTIGK
jgi:hypothetical protein